jgi:YVTN family beta-propeller protein
VAVTPDGSKVYVANQSSNAVSVINTATNAVGSILVGSVPTAFGQFILPRAFAGTPGTNNCHGQTISALAQRFGDLSAAANALGFSSVHALRRPLRRFAGHSC